MNQRNYQKNYKAGFGPLAIIIVIAIVAAIGGGVYHAKKQAEEKKMEGNATSTAETNGNANVSASGSLRDIIGMAKDVMCTFSGADASGQSFGTVYVSGTSMRGDFTVRSSKGATTNSHMIRNGDSAFVWSESQGAKMNMSDVMVSSKATAQSNSNVDVDKKVDYKCSPWVKDSSKFVTPTSVKFVDVSAMMKGALQVKTGSAK